MRIISGKSRGTKLFTLEGPNTRPTLDRVKEPLFSIINSYISDANILDLFAGSGALALEALSRGAESAVLCDNSKEAIRVINNNLEKTKLKAEIVNNDFVKCLEQMKGRQFDIIFLDPPYETNYLERAISKILECNLLSQDGIIVAETDNQNKVEDIEKLDITVKDIRRYGRVILIFLKRKG